MKEISKITLILAVIVALMFCHYYEHNYARRGCTVEAVHDSTVLIKDKCGFVWEYTNHTNEDYKHGEVVTLKMYDNYTPDDITDDIIKSIIKTN